MPCVPRAASFLGCGTLHRGRAFESVARGKIALSAITALIVLGACPSLEEGKEPGHGLITSKAGTVYCGMNGKHLHAGMSSVPIEGQRCENGWAFNAPKSPLFLLHRLGG